MELTEEKRRSFVRRLMLSRMRILVKNGFYGLLLMHARFALDPLVETAATDGEVIFFAPAFLEELSDPELDFVLMHEVMHMVLRHCARKGDRDRELFNIAADIVVNSNILHSCGDNPASITLQKYGESMHRTPTNEEGYLYTTEQVYAMLEQRSKVLSSQGAPGGKGKGKQKGKSQAGAGGTGKGWDDHSRWKLTDDEGLLRDLWIHRFTDACEAVQVRDPSDSRGLLPAFAKRILGDLRKPRTNWREVLQNFVEEDVSDYTFAPPDRRFGDNPFFLPEYGVIPDETVRDVLFMVDTSASVSDEAVTAAYAEILGAIEQFGGKLRGWLGFFDAAVYEPRPFETVEDVKSIRPLGGGGTDFGIIFRYVQQKMGDNMPSTIVILTDGYAPFPKESAAGGIPVLWLINNEKVTPPWGKVARM